MFSLRLNHLNPWRTTGSSSLAFCALLQVPTPCDKFYALLRVLRLATSFTPCYEFYALLQVLTPCYEFQRLATSFTPYYEFYALLQAPTFCYKLQRIATSSNALLHVLPATCLRPVTRPAACFCALLSVFCAPLRLALFCTILHRTRHAQQ
jgi:hypothetical protein